MSLVQLVHRQWVVAIVMLLLLVAFNNEGQASERLAPDIIEGSVKIDAEGLIELIERIPGLTIVDSRIASDRIQGHIEGSISLPDEKTNCQTLQEAVADPLAPVLFYCNGPKCGRSAVAVKIAISCGYKNVYWFRGGFEEWKKKKYPYIKE